MNTRNTPSYLIEQFKAQGIERIVPNSTIRFVNSHLSVLPASWQNLDRECLLKRVREACELGVSSGLLKRQRDKTIPGYIYQIL
jgi:hypothetical protein